MEADKAKVDDPCEMTLKGHTTGVRCCCFSSSGDMIASTAEDATLRLWDTASGAEITTVTGENAIAPEM